MSEPNPSARTLASRPAFTRRQRDFLLLNIFVFLQHGYVDRASVLADAMHVAGDEGPDVWLARAVLRFAGGNWREALDCLDTLDRIDPIERFGAYRLTNRQRMRRYLKLRCLHEVGDRARVRDALDSYMRHGEEGQEEGE